MTEQTAFLTLASGALGLTCWFIGLADHLYRMGLPRTPRSSLYDRLDDTCIWIGCACLAVFGVALVHFAWRNAR